jgi:hypothetical protein
LFIRGVDHAPRFQAWLAGRRRRPVRRGLKLFEAKFVVAQVPLEHLDNEWRRLGVCHQLVARHRLKQERNPGRRLQHARGYKPEACQLSHAHQRLPSWYEVGRWLIHMLGEAVETEHGLVTA